MNNFDMRSFQRGQEYVENVKFCFKKNELLVGDVVGTHVYRAKYDLQKEEGTCSCPVGYNCKHCVALYLTYKRGDFIDISIIEEKLNEFDKQNLITLLIDNIDEIPQLARKILDKSDFEKGFDEFLKNILVVDEFCLSDVERLNNLIEEFNFDELFRIYEFLEKNEHMFAEKIEEEYYNRMSRDYYSHYYDHYDEPLEDLKYDIEQKIFESVDNVEGFRKCLSLSKEFINFVSVNAQDFEDFKDEFDNYCQLNNLEENYFKYIINLKEVSADEILSKYKDDFRICLFDLVDENLALATKIFEKSDDKVLGFLIGVKTKNLDFSLKYFNDFDKYKIRTNNAIFFGFKFSKIEWIDKFVLLLKENKFRDNEFMSKLYVNYYLKDLYGYDILGRDSVRFLLSKVYDVEILKRSIDFKRDWNITKYLLKKISLLNIKEAKNLFFLNLNSLQNLHCDDAVSRVVFCRDKFGDSACFKFLTDNINNISNSHFKSRLKNYKIFVSFKRGDLDIEFR